MIRKLIPALAICLMSAAPAFAEEMNSSEAESAWRARGAQVEHRAIDRPGAMNRPETPPGPLVGDGIMPRLMRMREEASRLHRAPEEIVRERKELEEQLQNLKAEGKPLPERLVRRQRMIELRREMIEIERADFVERIQGALPNVEQFLRQREAEAAGVPPEQHGPLRRTLASLKEAKDFDAMYKSLADLPARPAGPAEGMERGGPGVERIVREMNALRERLDNLQAQMESLQQHETSRPPRPGRGQTNTPPGPIRRGQPPQRKQP